MLLSHINVYIMQNPIQDNCTVHMYSVLEYKVFMVLHYAHVNVGFQCGFFSFDFNAIARSYNPDSS